MKAREFHQLAVELAGSANPARIRTAISRAYYAAFHETAVFLREFGFRVGKGPGAHGEVRTWLFNSGDEGLMELASILADLHSKRIEADYKIDALEIEDREQSRRTLRRARMVLDALDDCRREPRRGELKEVIRRMK